MHVLASYYAPEAIMVHGPPLYHSGFQWALESGEMDRTPDNALP